MMSITTQALKCSRLPKVFMALCQQRHMTSSVEAKPEQLSKNLSFRPAFDSPIGQEIRPISLIYGWLLAKSKHIHKYGDFYLGKGFDVLHIKIFPGQLMWPLKTQQAIQQIVDFLDDPARRQQPILVHGFSVGGYLYGETLVKILQNPEKYGPLGRRIVGQIFDSPVDFEGIPRGVSKAVTPIPILQKTLQASLATYLSVFKKQTTDHYRRSSQTYRANSLQVPSIMLYSTADPVGMPGPIESVMQDWRRAGADVYHKCWSDSPHVSHFHHHPVQYIREVNSFLDKIGLNTQDTAELKKVVRKM